MTKTESENNSNTDSGSDSNTGNTDNGHSSSTSTSTSNSTSNSASNSNINNDNKWPMDVEAAFVEALGIIVKNGTSKIKIRDRNYGRNELISMYIWYKTGKYRTKKQISSHIQVWKKSLLAKRRSSLLTNENETYVLELIENGPAQNDETTRYFFNFFETIIATSLGSYPAFAISHRPTLIAPNVTLPLPMMSQQWYYPPPPPDGYYYPPPQAVYNFNFPNVMPNMATNNNLSNPNFSNTSNNFDSNISKNTRGPSDVNTFLTNKQNNMSHDGQNINGDSNTSKTKSEDANNKHLNSENGIKSNNNKSGSTVDPSTQKNNLPYPLFPNANNTNMNQFYYNGYRYNPPTMNNNQSIGTPNSIDKGNNLPLNPSPIMNGHSYPMNPNSNGGMQQYPHYGNPNYYVPSNMQMQPSIIQNSYTNNNTTNITNNHGSLPNIHTGFDMNNANRSNVLTPPFRQTDGMKDKNILNKTETKETLPSFNTSNELPSLGSFNKKVEPKLEQSR
ncbi:TEA/ATTS domain family [Nakaseomyces bracarensis]|uniref:TEA/ATTS domain family n=1 Tax=Nakaseomyces bracarensis TaxID=273131 RepID=A0ABR4NTX4_9SACH